MVVSIQAVIASKFHLGSFPSVDFFHLNIPVTFFKLKIRFRYLFSSWITVKPVCLLPQEEMFARMKF